MDLYEVIYLWGTVQPRPDWVSPADKSFSQNSGFILSFANWT
jgi:hypothetical protein